MAHASLVLVGGSSHGHEKDASAGQTEGDRCAGTARARDRDRLKSRRLLVLELLLTIPSLAERAGAAALGVVTALGEARVLLVDATGWAVTTLTPGGDCALGRRRGRRGGGSGWRGWGVHGAIAHAVANWTALRVVFGLLVAHRVGRGAAATVTVTCAGPARSPDWHCACV